MTEPRTPSRDDEPGVDEQAIAARLAVPPPPPALADAHVEAALAAFDEAHDTAAVTSLDAPRKRAVRYRRLPLGAVAAIVVVIALVGAAQLIAPDDRADETATADADDPALESAPMEGSADAPTAFDATGGKSSAGGAQLAPESLPMFASADELVAHLETVLAEGSAQASTTTRSEADHGEPGSETDGGEAPAPATTSDPCDPVAISGIDAEAVELTTAVVLDGRPVTALVHRRDGERRLVVVDTEQCQVTVERSF